MLRSIRAATGAVSAIVVVSFRADGQSMTYAPGTRHYELTAELHQKATTPGSVQEMTAKSAQHVTVTLTQRADTMDFTIVVDSVSFESTPPLTRPMDTARGRTAKGAMSPRGKLYRLAGADSLSNAVALTFGSFFPQLPSSTEIGHAWTDTTITQLQPNGSDFGKVVTISTSRIAGDTTIAGVRAWKIERVSDGSGGGVRSEAAGDMVMQAVLKVRSTMYVGMNGIYLGSAATSTSNITMTVAAVGLSVPLVQELTTRTRPTDIPTGSR
jgi:hypothetical protein